MEFDATTKQLHLEAFVAQNIPDDTPIVAPDANIIDSKGFESLTLALSMSNRQGSTTVSMLIEASDDALLASGVVSQLITDDPQTLIPADAKNLERLTDGVSRIGLIGKLRFYRVTITGATVTTGSLVQVLAILANPQNAPTFDQNSDT